jgi:preprotein translocase subunit SecF
MLNIIKYFKFWLTISIVLVVLSLIALFAFGLKLGIDFKGGTMTQITFESQAPSISDVKSTLSADGKNTDSVIQPIGTKSLIIRTGPIENDEHLRLMKLLSDKFGTFTEDQYSSIGPVIGKELKSKAIMQLILVSLGIIFYIAYAFRKVSKPVSSWKFGVAAVIALLHDLLIVIGVFALLGKFISIEIDSLFVTALLTVLGFSVHDTIVVFDRIRENLRIRSGADLGEIINSSINQTLIRSINTSLTVIFVLLALLLFGGESIRYFVLALLIGITAGTYSSIFIASPILLVWHKWDLRRRG